MNQIDSKILDFIEQLKITGKIRFDADFCRGIDMPKQRLWDIKNRGNHFTTVEVKDICRVFNLNANWLFSNDSDVFHKPLKSNIKTNQNQFSV